MKNKFFNALLCCLFSLSMFVVADESSSTLDVYKQIPDIYNPTFDDYRLIQDYLTNGDRPIIDRLKDYKPNARKFKIIGDNENEFPRSGLIAVNCDESDRENCLVCYSSFNKNYPRGLERLVRFTQDSDFQGHVLYRLGGWPNVEDGSLVLAHVPYAFKVCMIKEAQRLGFKRVFWLDTAVLPYVSLNDIFQMIKEKGYFVLGNSHMIGPYTDPRAATALGITMEEADNIPSVSAGIFGVDFSNEIGAEIVNRWYAAAFDPDAYFSSRSDQSALSAILYKMGITESDFVSIRRMAHSKNEINAQTLLLISREFVNELSL